MKKIIIVLTALTITLGANAQNLNFGVKAGMNLSSLSSVKYGSDKQDASSMVFGFHAGGYAHYAFNEMFGVQGELLFSTQGGKKKGFGDADVRFNFINVPLLLSLTIPNLPELRFFGGTQVGFNISRKVTWSDGYSLSGSQLDDALKVEGEQINTFDLASVVGVQYTFVEHFTLGARYNMGLLSGSSATTEAKAAGYSISGNKHNVIQISFGWTF
jgi:hypothetical protein